MRAAKESDVAVLFIGLPDSYESEGYDRDHLRLPQSHDRLVEEVAAAQPNTVVVLHNGSPSKCLGSTRSKAFWKYISAARA